MKGKVRWIRLLHWVGAACACTVVLFIPLVAVPGSLLSPVGLASALPAAVLLTLYSPYLVPLIVGITAPLYLLCFWSWASLCARRPRLERGFGPLLLVAVAVSVPLGAILAAICAEGPRGIVPRDLLTYLPFCSAMFWGAIVGPRWMSDSLRPGSLSDAPEHGA